MVSPHLSPEHPYARSLAARIGDENPLLRTLSATVGASSAEDFGPGSFRNVNLEVDGQARRQCGEPELELLLAGDLRQLVEHASNQREVGGHQAGELPPPAGRVGGL